jgi:adenylate cyclase
LDRLYRFEDIEIDLQNFRLFKAGKVLPVEPKALNLLIFLVENRGRLVQRREIIDAVWKGAFVSDHVLNRAIGQLRKLLADDPKEPRYIETVPTLGYRFVADVEPATQTPLAANAVSAGFIADRPSEPLPAPAEAPNIPSSAREDHPGQAIAVLPFVNLSPDPENEFFADGITEDVIAHLAKIRSMKVISRSSVMVFKKRDCSLREIGEKLGAATLLDGSVRRAGNRVRIVAQLIDRATDENIWAETYDRDLTDIFAIQSDVALNIANALRAELSRDERERVDRRPTYDLQAYENYLRGRDLFYRFTEESMHRSLIDFHAAVDRDPGFALAWASIAEVHTELCIQGCAGVSVEKAIPSAKAAVERALEIDPELAEAHSILGLIRFTFDFNWGGAEREFLRAIDLSPGSAQVHDHYSWLCASLERYDDALRHVRLAHELNPIAVRSDVTTMLLRAGRIEEALEEARRSVESEPRAPRCHSGLGWALIFHGESALGLASIEHAVAIAPGSTIFLAQLGQACAMTGDTARARQILAQLQQRAEREFVTPYHFAYIHAGLGETDTAIDCLERAFEQRSGAIYGIKGSFLFRNLRTNPRFESLLHKMNLA